MPVSKCLQTVLTDTQLSSFVCEFCSVKFLQKCLYNVMNLQLSVAGWVFLVLFCFGLLWVLGFVGGGFVFCYKIHLSSYTPLFAQPSDFYTN